MAPRPVAVVGATVTRGTEPFSASLRRARKRCFMHFKAAGTEMVRNRAWSISRVCSTERQILGGHDDSNCNYGCGTVYRISTAGAEKVLYRFTGSPDGAFPTASLIDVNGMLYGTTGDGGKFCNFTLLRNGVQCNHGRRGGGTVPLPRRHRWLVPRCAVDKRKRYALRNN